MTDSIDLIKSDDMAEMSIEELLDDTSFTDYEEAMDFENYPKGIWTGVVKHCKVETFDGTDANGKKAKRQKLAIEVIPSAAVELKNEEEDQVLADRIVESKMPLQVAYLPGFGMTQFTTHWRELASALGLAGLRAFQEGIGGTEIQFEIKHYVKKGKNGDEDRTYVNLRNIEPIS